MPSGDLATLESLLREFYQPTTSNERKREIEDILGQFQRLPESWQHCVAFLKETEDAYVQMFCLIVLDSTVTQRWRVLSTEQKCSFTQFLHELLQSDDRRLGGHFSFVRNKVAKLIVEIGRSDWPQAYPDFLENILKMLALDEYVATGLLLLRTASDELLASGSASSVATSAERRDELRRLLLADAQRMLERLGALLDTLLRAYRSDTVQPRNGELMSFEPTRCLHLDERGLRLASGALQCLASLFSWVPPSAVKSTLLIHTFSFISCSISVIASGGANARDTLPICTCGRPITNALQLVEVGGSALSCLTELLARSYSPPDFMEFVAQANVCTYITLCRLCALDYTSGSLADRVFGSDALVACFSGELLRNVSDAFLDQLTKFLRVFLSAHFAVLEREQRSTSSGHVTVRELLAAFYCYTFVLSPARAGGAFGVCLDVWHLVLDTVGGLPASRRSVYNDMLVALARRLTVKMQFRLNHAELEQLDCSAEIDSNLDGDAQTVADADVEEATSETTSTTELRTFVARAVETLSKLGTLVPTDTFAVVADLFAAHAQTAVSLGRCFVDEPDVGHLPPPGPAGDVNSNALSRDVRFRLPVEASSQAVHCALRDLATFALAVARLVPDLLCGTAEQFSARFTDGEAIVTHLVNVTKLFAAKRVWRARCVTDPRDMSSRSLARDLIAAHSECLRALAAVSSSWLTQFRALCVASSNAELLSSVDTLFAVLVDDCVAPALSRDAPPRVSLSAAQLLVVIVRCRPARLLDTSGFRSLTERAATVDGFVACPRVVLSALYRAIVSGFLSAQPDVSNVAQLLDRFVSSLSAPLMRPVDCADSHARRRILHVLGALSDVVAALHGEPTRVKQAAARSLDGTVECALRLVPQFADSLELLDALANFVLSTARELRGTLRSALLDSIWSTFAALLDGPRLTQAVVDGAMQRTDAACAALTRFVELLTFVVQDAAFRARLADVLRVALERVYPPLAAHDAFMFVRPAFFNFVQDVLVSNWHFFFKQQFAFGASLTAKEQMRTENNADDVAEHRDQLIALMRVLADGLLNSQPAIFRAALGALETLHTRHRLYTRSTFRTMMLERFIELLLSRLVDRTHAALHDEICTALFNAANAVEMTHFRSIVVPQFVVVDSSVGFSDEQRAKLCAVFGERDSDLPSFTNALGRFAQDFCFYAQANAVERDRDRLGGLFRLDAQLAR